MSTQELALDDRQRRRRAKSLAIGVVLAGLALLFYIITMVKIGAGP